MGVYLSAPIVEKESFDEQCNGFIYGASSMQGWRVTQEDAHNCIPEFDEPTSSFFAVYDGHGGAEVAKYCHLNFPNYVKSMIDKKKEGDLIDMIRSAFLEFDATLTEEDVIKKLKELAGKDDENEEEEDPDVPVGRTEADMLKAEADMPLEELLAKYKTDPNTDDAEKVTGGESSGSSSSNLQPASSTSSSAPASSSCSVNGPSKAEEGSNVNNNENSLVSDSNQSGEGIQSKALPDSSSSGVSSTTDLGGSATGQRASKTKAASDIAMADCPDDSSDDDDDDAEEEEDMWEDMSDDEDDDEEEDVDNDVPMMDMTNEEPGSDSGCTACVVLKQRQKLYVANAGDSRCVLSRNGVAVELSFDHKPEDDPERERIEKAGGKVTADGRVNGGLNLSRAFGDHVYKRNTELPSKEQMISALPDIKTIELGSSDQFFVIACDGIWNSLSSQEVVDYVKERLSDPEKRKKPSLICEELFDHCLAPNILGDGTGCDNMTCILVVLDSANFSIDIANHKDEKAEAVDESDSVPDNGENEAEQKESLKRVVDNGETEQAKRVKVGEETG